MEFNKEIYLEADRILSQLFTYFSSAGLEITVKDEQGLRLEELKEKNSDMLKAYLRDLKEMIEMAQSIVTENLEAILKDTKKVPLLRSGEFFPIEGIRRFLLFIEWELAEKKEATLYKEQNIYTLLKYSSVELWRCES